MWYAFRALALLLRHAHFAWLILNGVAQHNRVGTTPGDEEGVPANAYIYVFVLWGGAVRKQQHIFYKLPNELPSTYPTSWNKLPSNQGSKIP